MGDVDKWEERAKLFDERLPQLAKALRSKTLQDSCADISMYGWILSTSAVPRTTEDVLVTNGIDVWIGNYDELREQDGGKWIVFYKGDPPPENTKIVAWIYKPYVPAELRLK